MSKVDFEIIARGEGWEDYRFFVDGREHGFYGWSKSSYGHDVSIRQLIFLKAVVKERLSDLELEYSNEMLGGPKSSFDKEMDILFS